MNFSVVDDGGPQLRIHTADIHFEDIQVEAHGSLSWLYNAMLVLFHDQIVTKIESRMNQALMHDVPAKLNSYLQALPSTVRPAHPSQACMHVSSTTRTSRRVGSRVHDASCCFYPRSHARGQTGVKSHATTSAIPPPS